MAYHKIDSGTIVYFRGESGLLAGLYKTVARFSGIPGDYDQARTLYTVVKAHSSETPREYTVERHQLLERQEIKEIYDTIMEVYSHG